MVDKVDTTHQVNEAYQQQAIQYDRSVGSFNLFKRFGFDLDGWQTQAISALNLKPGDTVIDIGCGTGLNFSRLQQAVTATGKIIGVDLSAAMLEEAQTLIDAHQWQNVELACADATQYAFPQPVHAILSTYALILIPDCERVITNAYDALIPDGRFSVLDMAWPSYCPLWWRHVLFFLRSYGVTEDTLRRRSWETVQTTMAERLSNYSQKQMWFGFFYLASGTKTKTSVVSL